MAKYLTGFSIGSVLSFVCGVIQRIYGGMTRSEINTHYTLHKKSLFGAIFLHMSKKITTFDLLPLVFNRGPFESTVASCSPYARDGCFCQYYVLRLVIVYMPHLCKHMQHISNHKT